MTVGSAPAPRLDHSTELILDRLTNLKTDIDKRFESIESSLGKNTAESQAHAVHIGRLEERFTNQISELTLNKAKLWAEVERLRLEQSDQAKALEVHTISSVAVDATESEIKQAGFNWANVLTPTILTIGLAVIGYMVAKND